MELRKYIALQKTIFVYVKYSIITYMAQVAILFTSSVSNLFFKR